MKIDMTLLEKDSAPTVAELKAFFAEVGVKLVSLSGKPLFDYGGAVTIEI